MCFTLLSLRLLRIQPVDVCFGFVFLWLISDKHRALSPKPTYTANTAMPVIGFHRCVVFFLRSIVLSEQVVCRGESTQAGHKAG